MPIFNSENLLGSPLGMAGLGLLMQPTVSRNPQNPMGAALGGVMAAGQYRNDQQQFAGQQQEAAMRAQRLQFEMDEALRKREQEAQQLAQAERQKAEIEKAVQESGDPALRSLYAIGGPEAAAKYLGESMKPASPLSGVGKLAADLRAANPSMSVADSMMQAEGMLNERASRGAANISLGAGQEPLKVTDLNSLRTPGGAPLPYGTTQEQAIAAGATPVPPETPQEQDDRTLALEKERIARARAEQNAIAQNNLALLEDEIKRNGGLRSIIPGSPVAQKIEGYRTAAAIAAARAQSPKPEQEPNDSIVDQFRAMLPGYLMGSFGVTSGIDAGYDLVGGRPDIPNPVSQTGVIAPSQSASQGEWVTLPNGVRVREKTGGQ